MSGPVVPGETGHLKSLWDGHAHSSLIQVNARTQWGAEPALAPADVRTS